MRRILIMAFLATTLAGACTTGTTAPMTAATSSPGQISLTKTAFHLSLGGGEPRSAAYWLIWNTCAAGNQAEIARANGGRQAGWILMDDLLADPGILLGAITVDECMQGVMLLQAKDAGGAKHDNDPVYLLAAQFFTAELNLAAGSETCPASDKYIYDSQLLLEDVGFNGSGNYMGPPRADPNVETVTMLTDMLASYNVGTLCVP